MFGPYEIVDLAQKVFTDFIKKHAFPVGWDPWVLSAQRDCRKHRTVFCLKFLRGLGRASGRSRLIATGLPSEV